LGFLTIREDPAVGVYREEYDVTVSANAGLDKG